MIKEFYLKNFKLINELNLQIKPITVLLGENSSGKSSVLQSLALFQGSIGSGNSFPHGYNSNVTLGGFRHIINKIPKESNNLFTLMRFGFTFPVPDFSKRKRSVASHPDYRIQFDFRLQDFYSEICGIEAQLLNTKYTTLKLSDKRGGEADYSYIDDKRIERKDSPYIPLPSASNITGNIVLISTNPDQHKTDTEQILELRELFTNFIKQLVYIPPFRGIRSLGYPLETIMPTSLGSKEREGFESAIVNILSKIDSEDFEKMDRLNNALEKYFEVEIGQSTPETRSNVDNIPIVTIKVKDKLTGVQTSIVNTGFGTNQAIILGIAMVYLDHPSIIAIEEPEIHLHPKKQADMFDYINTLRQNNTVIISTHSDHFLVRLQQRIREKTVKSQDVIIYYFKRSSNGVTIDTLEIDEEGRIEGGLPGFFEHNLDEFKRFIDSLEKDNEKDEKDKISI